ncbi:hypothetical protein C0J52_26989, partial [Blattella germanica]
LTPCDFFIRGFVKYCVYLRPHLTTLDGLRDRIRTIMAAIDLGTLQRVLQEIYYRLDMCRVMAR